MAKNVEKVFLSSGESHDRRSIPVGETLTFDEARQSPCATCHSAPCCTHLPLEKLSITTMMDLDRARYLLNFNLIQLGLSRIGEWTVFYLQPCRHLDKDNLRCSVHDQPEQPQVCRQFNPYTCWYKETFAARSGSEYLQIDRGRMDHIAPKFIFDENRRIVESPSWESLIEELPPLEDSKLSHHSSVDVYGPRKDEALRNWKKIALGEPIPNMPKAELRRYDSLRDPCQDCQAYCCTFLTFPQGAATTISTLDHYRFCLGFPGVELGISEKSWFLVVRTICRHLEGNRCQLFGQPERPLTCRYYDAWKCTYKVNFGYPRSPGYVRVNYEQFEVLAKAHNFDEHGNIINTPSVDELRQMIEESWRQQVAG